MLTSGLRILPVLGDGATMPTPDELPEDIRPLTNLNAMLVSHESFERDLGALVSAILSRPVGSDLAIATERHPLRARLLRSLVCFLVSGAGLVVAAAVHNAFAKRSLEETLGGSGQVWLLILGVLTLGTLAGALTQRTR
jgi:hypothetical protein